MGQNFLSDPRVAARIAALVTDPREPVLEIGPGLGALTTLLAHGGRPLIAVELDLRLAEVVEGKLASFPTARVVRGDILDQRVDTLFAGIGAQTETRAGTGIRAGTALTVVGNLPYSITTPIVEWILAQGSRVNRAFVMVQREYAERLAASPGGKEYGSISVFVDLHAEVSTHFRVSAGAFHPRPEVDSIVLELTPRPYPGSTAEERNAAERLARAGMGKRRKTVGNSLARGLEVEGARTRALLEAAGIDVERRGETLSVDEWLAVARQWLADGMTGLTAR
jgi:16S rRNA (adenine1518-N6/adenine1519-N6)-dimethyltransferase